MIFIIKRNRNSTRSRVASAGPCKWPVTWIPDQARVSLRRSRPRLGVQTERAPFPFREPIPHMRSVRRRTWRFGRCPISVSHPVAPPASCGNVACMATAIAPCNQMFSRCLKPMCLANRQVVPGGEPGFVHKPHGRITVAAATALLRERGTPQTNHDGMTHKKVLGKKEEGSPVANAANSGYPPAKAEWATHRRLSPADGQ